ncbi:MAG TPA: AAA family ATPase [Candidatus Kapabacteria bacterium]|nr:AAA family ATPase [Candidatus Kapabacteria bacterium]
MWSNVIGEERVKHILQSAIARDMLPGAYLFSGPEGTGKDAAAIELAKAINCQQPTAAGACDECASCLSIASFASTAIQFVHALPKKSEGDDAELKEEDVAIVREQRAAKAADPYYNFEIPRAQAIHIGQIRELRLSLARSISGAKKRIVIISEADRMNPQSQNAFLKTLEEPHADTIIILTSSNPNGLLPTVHSRTQEVRFDVLSVGDIRQALMARESLAEADADFLARIAAGSYSRARAMIGDDVKQMRTEIVGFLRMGLSKSRRNAALEIDKFLPRSGGGKFLEKRQAVEQRLVLLTLWLRDALALSTKAEGEIINRDQLEDLTKFVARLGEPRRIIAAIASVDRAMHRVKLQLQLRAVMMELVVELEQALVNS